MEALKIARNFTLPVEAVTQTFAILAKRGAGKSYTASVMAEEMLANDLLPVIIDPLGVWWGLQSSADGNRAGYPITVLGGDHGDVPLEPGAGETIADFVVNEQQPCVLDLSRFRKADQIRFVTAFAERLYQKNRDPLHLFVDEADLFAPQRAPQGHEARCLGAMEDLSRRGRAKGIGMTLVTQRSAVLNKNVLTQIEVLVVLRTTSPQDRKAIKDWVDVHGEEEQWQQMNKELPKLPIGTAYLWSPGWLDVMQKLNVRTRRTFDSSATPKVGERRIEPKRRAQPDLDALSERIAATIERAKKEDPRELRKRIAELESQAAQRKEEVRVEEVEVPVFPPQLKTELTTMLDGVARVAEELIETTGNLQAHMDAGFDLDLKPMPSEKIGAPQNGRKKPQLQSEDNVARRAAPPRADRTPDDEVKLKAGARRMVETLARLYPLRMTRTQLATLAGMAPKGGTYNTYYGQIKRAGFVVEEGSDVVLTEQGFDYLGETPTMPMSTEERIDMWRGNLKAGARRMLDTLVVAHPRSLTRQELAEEVEMEPSGGTFNTYLGTLRRNGLAEVDGAEVTAGEALFVGA
jgi:hypothetical protein